MRISEGLSLLYLAPVLLLAVLLTACAFPLAGNAIPTRAPGSAATETPTTESTAVVGSSTAVVAPQPTPTLTVQEMAGREYEKLVYGRSAFNPPKEMTVGMAEIVTYRVVYGVEIITPTLIAEIPTEPNRQIITSTVRIASRMKATLKGDGSAFTITPLHSTEEKVILPNEPNDWSWNVTPNESGQHTLILALTAVIEVGDKNVSYDLPIDTKTVNILINWNLFAVNIIKNFWAQLTAVLGIVATGIELAWRRIKKSSAVGALWRSIRKQLRTENTNNPDQQERPSRSRRDRRRDRR